MSLKPGGRSARGSSKSPARGDRDRSRSRSDARASSPSRSSRGRRDVSPPASTVAPIPPSYGNGVVSPIYEVRSPASAGTHRSSSFSQTSSAPVSYPPPPVRSYSRDDGGFTMGDYTDLPPSERPGYPSPSAPYPAAPRNYEDGLAYGGNSSPNASRQNSYAPYPPQPPQPLYSSQQHGNVTSPTQYPYAQGPETANYTAKPYPGSQPSQYNQNYQGQYAQSAYDRNAQIVTTMPGSVIRDKSPAGRMGLSPLDTRNPGGLPAPPSPGLSAGMGRLSVGAALGSAGVAGNLPPPSPLLEAYRGTYQQMSPMPFAIRPMDDDDELDSLQPLSPARSRTESKGSIHFASDTHEKEKKRVKVYDPEEDAKTISKALSHTKIDAETLCDVLPGLSHDQIVYLRKEYKKLVKVQGKGVNLSKHIKTKVPGNLGKVAYVTSLGRWESEGYWANFWYQSHSSRRELLIESLMGRTNAEIWNIKDEFKDKRYSDSLIKCMEKELKMDKFRTAVLMVLEERRQEEQDVYPVEYRNRDVDMLHRALTAEKGGESVMLEIIVRRSDAHLREVLRTYQATYNENFPKAALKKSNNLVGEVIAHILNGVINKPARDALLLQHAIKDIAEKNREEELRYELLISRLVRVHWDKVYLMRVKREYYERYQMYLEKDIEEATSGDFGDFLYNLCQTK